MSENFVLSKEEEEIILARRASQQASDTAPVGIGTGRVWARAKLKKLKFIDELTFIERNGKY
jgi:hypothetical protein